MLLYGKMPCGIGSFTNTKPLNYAYFCQVRVGYDAIKRIQIGERICLATHDKTSEVKISVIRRYQSFEEMLAREPWQRIAPDASSQAEVLQLLKQIYPPTKEKLGVIVLEFLLR